MSTQHRDYMRQLPGHPTGIPAGLGKSELNEGCTEDFIQTIRTIHLPGRKRFYGQSIRKSRFKNAEFLQLYLI